MAPFLSVTLYQCTDSSSLMFLTSVTLEVASFNRGKGVINICSHCIVLHDVDMLMLGTRAGEVFHFSVAKLRIIFLLFIVSENIGATLTCTYQVFRQHCR